MPVPSPLPVAATLLALAGIRTGETVVDAGCGTGALTPPPAAAAGETGRVYGVDADPALLAAARDRRPSRVVWVRADPSRLPVGGGCVDKLLCGTALHALPDVAAALAEYARVLRPGGRIAVAAWAELRGGTEAAVHAALSADGGDGAAPDRRALLRAGGVVYPAATLPHLIRAAGLRVVHETEDEVGVAFEGAVPYAAWRLSFTSLPEGERPAAAARLAALLPDEPLVATASVQYATATTG
jgi:SAM-dependent methyltransferase